jgi:hypothetical protein
MAKSEIEQFIADNENMDVEVSPGVSYSLRDIINNNYRLFNAQFQSGEYEENGFKRIFMRKMWVVYRTLIQGSDLDLKNLNVRSTNGIKQRLTGLMRQMFVSHLSRNFFGEYVDDNLAFMCWHGSSITKRVDGKLDLVDLRNYITEPNIQNPQERRHAEMCYYTYDQVFSNKKDWDNFDAVERVWEAMQKENQTQFKIVEFWTFDKEGKKVCQKWLDNTITESESFHDTGEWQPYIKLEEFETPYSRKRQSKRMAQKLGKEEKMFPYEQADLFKIPGRALAMGCGELLAGTQELYNELYTNKRKLDLKALAGITVHTAIQGVNGLTQLTQDFISNLTTGAVVTLSPGETLEQLRTDTNAADFTLMEEKIYELMRQIIGITAQGTGEEQPASTSATQASINQQVANTVFDYTRERMQHFIKRLFNNGYADDIIEELDEKEAVAIVGDAKQLEEIDKYLVDNALNKWALEYKNALGMYPTEDEYLIVQEELRNNLREQGDMRFPEFKKAMLEGMEYLFEFDITQEAFDIKLRSDALIAMKNDSESTKSKAKLEDELLVLQGLNPSAYDLSPEEKLERQQMAQQEQMAQQNAVQARQTAVQAPQPVI